MQNDQLEPGRALDAIQVIEVLSSIAISMKRIADTLDYTLPQQSRDLTGALFGIQGAITRSS